MTLDKRSSPLQTLHYRLILQDFVSFFVSLFVFNLCLQICENRVTESSKWDSKSRRGVGHEILEKWDLTCSLGGKRKSSKVAGSGTKTVTQAASNRHLALYQRKI